MRHQKRRHNLNRFTSWRRATLNSMSRNILLNQSIKTTKVKAKATRPLIENLITLGKKNNLSARRKAFSILQSHKLVRHLFSEIAPRFRNQNGGYTRIIPFSFRRGDGAELVVLEFTQKMKPLKKKTAKKAKDENALASKGPVPETPEKPSSLLTKEKKPEKKLEKAPEKTPDKKTKEKPQEKSKDKHKFLGGLRKIFKKDRNSL